MAPNKAQWQGMEKREQITYANWLRILAMFTRLCGINVNENPSENVEQGKSERPKLQRCSEGSFKDSKCN